MAVDRVTAAQLERKSAIRRAGERALAALWQAEGGPDDARAGRFVETATEAHTQALSAQVAAYVQYADVWAETAGLSTGPNPVDVDEVIAATRNGTPVNERMQRVVTDLRVGLADGLDYQVAFAQAARRLESIVGTDHQQAYRLSNYASWRGTEVRGYQRVLQGPENCGLCLVASTRRYRSDKLMPIHPGCDCGVAPFIGDVERSGAITDKIPDLDAVMRVLSDQGISYYHRGALVNTKLPADLTDRLADVGEHNHGELGPILGLTKHRHTTPPNFRSRRREFADDLSGRLVRDATR